jgi:hypothetical protein
LEQTYREIATVPQYFAYCHWLLYNTTYGWESDRWLEGAEDYTKSIALFKNTPVGAWGETLPGGIIVPPLPPLPPEDPPIVVPPAYPLAEPTVWLIPTWNDAFQQAAVPPGALHWHLTRAEMLTDNTMDHTVYVDAPEPQSTVHTRNANGQVEVLPFKAPELRNRPLWKDDTLEVWCSDMDGHDSDRVFALHGRYSIPDANLFHMTYKLTFRLCQMPGVVVPPVEPPITPPSGATSTTYTFKTGDITIIQYGPDMKDIIIHVANT